MKKLFKILLISLLFVLLSGFRAPNGVIISKGDFADKLILNLGQPRTRTNLGLVPVRVFGGLIYIQREMWLYRIDQYNYRFTIDNGQIVNDHWSRF
ncbi:MAG: hypothetical protein WAU15_11690 [Nitrosomonas sp.]